MILLVHWQVTAEYGCMAKSSHLEILNDQKDYYYVTGPDGGPCPCPCSRYCAQFKRPFNRGKCPVCGHYRVPRPLVIVESPSKSVQQPPVRAVSARQHKSLRNVFSRACRVGY